MKRMWSGRLRPAVSKGLSLTRGLNAVTAAGAPVSPVFAGVADQVMSTVPMVVARDAVHAAIVAIVANEAKALADGESETPKDSVIEARMRHRAREQFVRGGEVAARQWGGELALVIGEVLRAVIALKQPGHTIAVEIPLIAQVRDAALVIDGIVSRVLGWSSEDGRFRPGGLVARRVKFNLLNASNMTEEDARKRPQKLVWPKSAKGSAIEVVERYLDGTPFAALLLSGVPWGIGERELCESVHIMARTGHGKSQLLQYMIGQLLSQPDPPALIVIDSQGEMLQRIGRLRVFAPGGILADRLVWVDPREMERPVAVNPFAKNRERTSVYSGAMRE